MHFVKHPCVSQLGIRPAIGRLAIHVPWLYYSWSWAWSLCLTLQLVTSHPISPTWLSTLIHLQLPCIYILGYILGSPSGTLCRMPRRKEKNHLFMALEASQASRNHIWRLQEENYQLKWPIRPDFILFLLSFYYNAIPLLWLFEDFYYLSDQPHYRKTYSHSLVKS